MYALLRRLSQLAQVRADSIAKRGWSEDQKAGYAALWTLGLLQIIPTEKMAAKVFGVPIALVKEALANIEISPLPEVDRVDVAEVIGEAELLRMLEALEVEIEIEALEPEARAFRS